MTTRPAGTHGGEIRGGRTSCSHCEVTRLLTLAASDWAANYPTTALWTLMDALPLMLGDSASVTVTSANGGVLEEGAAEQDQG
jgi:hypothetical protein